ncbi:MAG: MFS transporter [Methanomassiliicoccus sp.]|nr:MFS transporter [Methanomassiliicoccus sp.]
MTDDSMKPGYEWTVLSVTTIGILMSVMQSSALLIALPDMMSALHMGMFTVMWVLLVYMLITTAMVPLFGRLADMFGRKNLYVLGFGVFTLGSLLCVFASPANQGMDLIVYRIVQALGGALVTANGTPMVADAFKANRLGLGLGINGIAAGAGMVMGPVVGGILAPYGWEWIFLYNVPFGILGTVWAYVRLKEPANVPKTPGFDWWGCATFIVGMSSLLLAVSLYSFPMGLSMDTIYALFVIGAVGIAAFIWVELRAKTPMLDLHLFKNPDFAIGCTTSMLNGLTRGAMLFLLIFFLQGPYGQDPLTAGLSLIPMGLAMIVIAPLSGRAADRQGTRPLIVGGLGLMAVSMLGLVFIDHNTPFWWLMVLTLVSGIAGSVFMSPNSKSVMNAAPPERRGIASGTRMMLMNVGSMVSMAVAIPMVMTGLSNEDMTALFLYGGGISSEALVTFENGLHQAFLLFLIISLITFGISLLKFKPAKVVVEDGNGRERARSN